MRTRDVVIVGASAGDVEVETGMTMQVIESEAEPPQPVVVAHLRGSLTLANASRVRIELEKCLADVPDAMVIDLSRVIVAHRLALVLLSTVARAAAVWPGAAIVACVPQLDVRRALEQLAVARQLLVCADLASALAQARPDPVPHQLRQVLLPTPKAPGQARAIIADACRAWGVPSVASSARVVVSEIVANAVVHARTAVVLTARLREHHLLLAARDGSRRRVRRGGPVDAESASGRGLLIVEALSAAWGSTLTDDGKVVWASLRVPALTAPQSPRR